MQKRQQEPEDPPSQGSLTLAEGLGPGHPAHSPVGVKALQLPLHSAADAAAVAAVQPAAHHAQAVVPLLPAEGKVLYLGGDALATLGHGDRGVAMLLPAGDGGTSA